MKTGKALGRDVSECGLKKGECAIWWLGQDSFIVKFREKTVYLDPFLSPHPRRQVQPLLAPSDVVNADLVCGTHDHADHIDRRAWPCLSVSSPSAKFIVPDLLLSALANDLNIPLGRFVGLDDGQTVEVNGVRITGIAAAHEFLDRDSRTGRYPYLGYIIEADGLAVYHAGDTCLYEGMETKLRRWKFDVVFLPINGRDAKRLSANCIGNMTYQEAADLAGAIMPRLTIPSHFDMFAENSENPNLFVDYMRVKYPHLKVTVCQYGEPLIIFIASNS